MALVYSFSVNSARLNLQCLCSTVHLFDTPMSNPIAQQAISQVRQLGQTWIVKVYDYQVQQSFNCRQVANDLSKVIPGMVAELNPDMFAVRIQGILMFVCLLHDLTSC